MNFTTQLKKIISDLKEQAISEESALHMLEKMYIHPMGETKWDSLREHRSGIAEVVFCKDKSVAQIDKILQELSQEPGRSILFTRLDKEKEKKLTRVETWFYDEQAQCGIFGKSDKKLAIPGKILIITAGTSDQSVAMEALITCDFFGISAKLITDVGVSGIHRLFAYMDEVKIADAIIVVAGMEGALASVVTGLVSCPVIGVPTSTGYGTSMGGLTALFAMLNSCSPGISVVNIDNGFGAACCAIKIVKNRKS